jgi:hypothetical protein
MGEWDSYREPSMVADGHAQTYSTDPQDDEPDRLQQQGVKAA